MKTIKVSEATGHTLDYLVAMAENLSVIKDGYLSGYLHYGFWVTGHHSDLNKWDMISDMNYSTNWLLAGRIIEREKIDSYYSTAVCLWAAAIWEDAPGGGHLKHKQTDCSTPLIAAMRCYATSKLGDTYDVPEGLTS